MWNFKTSAAANVGQFKFFCITHVHVFVFKSEPPNLSPIWAQSEPQSPIDLRLFWKFRLKKGLRIVSRSKRNLFVSETSLLPWHMCSWIYGTADHICIVYISISYIHMVANGDKNKKTDALAASALTSWARGHFAQKQSTWMKVRYILYIIIYNVYKNNINYDMYRRNRKWLRRIRRVNICSITNKFAAGLI